MRLSVLAGISLVLGSCATLSSGEMERVASENRSKLSQLSVGMLRLTVRELVGSKTVVDEGFAVSLVTSNPFRSETLRGTSKVIEVDYYMTDVRKPGLTETQLKEAILTPLVFEDGRLIGWDWPFLYDIMKDHLLRPASEWDASTVAQSLREATEWASEPLQLSK